MSDPPAYWLRASAVAAPLTMLEPGWVAVSGDRLDGVGDGPPAGGPVIDLGARTIAAGLVDIHVHGGHGAQFNGSTPEEVAASALEVARAHVRHGTTTMLATTVADTAERLRTTVAGLAAAIAEGPPDGARIGGINLEGPYLAPGKTGAQDPDALRPPDLAELASLQQLSGGRIRMITLAPELPGAARLIVEATGLGIRPSIGHTVAGFEDAAAAVEAGARHATHLFNAMPALHHRQPGAVAALLLDERVSLELIADLEHLHPAILELVARLAGDRICLVTDAVAAVGLPDGRYELGRLQVEVSGGRVAVAGHPETLAGSTLTMERAVANLASSTGLGLHACLRAASAVPARAAGLGSTGGLVAGAAADLVVLEAEGTVAATVVGGRPVWDPSGLLAGIG